MDIQWIFNGYSIPPLVMFRFDLCLLRRTYQNHAFPTFPTRCTFSLEVTKIARLSLKLALSFVDRPASGFATGLLWRLEELQAANSTKRLIYVALEIAANP